jgi:hypothetical protein
MVAIESMSRRMSSGHSGSHTEPHSRLFLKHASANIPIKSIEMPSNSRNQDGASPTQDDCYGGHDDDDPTISISSTTRIAGQTVAPFLAKHIPEQYAPLGVQEPADTKSTKDPNTKYCYRHRPDSKCKRTANEPSMENLQRVSMIELFTCSLLTSIGPGIALTSRSASHISRLVTFLRCSSKASESHASRHSYTMLLPSAIIPIHCRSRFESNRLHYRSSRRGVI